MSTFNGNYKSYYRSRRNDTDNRLALFNGDWFAGKKCLDVGCNEGVLTMKLAKTYHPDFIIGIDLDAVLIDAANASVKRAILEAARLAALSSMDKTARSSSTSSSSSSRSFSFIPRQVAMTKASLMKTPADLPYSASRTFLTAEQLFSSRIGSIPTAGVFPDNVAFVCKNAIDFLKSCPKYDAVLCLSVTKWIHLTEGDDGLLTLFRIIHQLTAPGGRAIIEYQPWRSYVKNQKASATTMAVFKTLRIRPEDFETILTRDFGFRIEYRLGPPLSESKGFNRPILVLVKDVVSAGGVGMDCEGDTEGESCSMTSVYEGPRDAVSACVSADSDPFGMVHVAETSSRKRRFGEVHEDGGQGWLEDDDDDDQEGAEAAGAAAAVSSGSRNNSSGSRNNSSGSRSSSTSSIQSTSGIHSNSSSVYAHSSHIRFGTDCKRAKW